MPNRRARATHRPEAREQFRKASVAQQRLLLDTIADLEDDADPDLFLTTGPSPLVQKAFGMVLVTYRVADQTADVWDVEICEFRLV